MSRQCFRVTIEVLLLLALLLNIGLSFMKSQGGASEVIPRDIKEEEEAPTQPKSEYTRTSSKRCAFVDLGANQADTFRVFLRHPSVPKRHQMNFTLPEHTNPYDCEIFLVEASKMHTEKLKETYEEYKDKVRRLEVFPETAATTVDGPVTFYLDTVNKDHNFWGASLQPFRKDVKASGLHNVTVQGMDIAGFLKREFTADDWVVLKVDIEGAEYAVLNDVYIQGASKLVDVLYVEFHGNSNPKLPGNERLIEMFHSEGVITPKYHSNTRK